MRADVVAAFLDYPDTRALAVAIEMGDAPRPTSMRRTGKTAVEPVWSAEAVADFVRLRHAPLAVRSETGEGLEKLVPRPKLPNRG
jgi:hypothetical protein